MSIVAVKNVTYNIDNFTICNDINIAFKKDTFTGIIGPNGSGKSTLLKQIYRLIKPTNGSIYLNGENLDKINSKLVAKEMAVLPQEHHSDFDYTVDEVVMMGRFPYHKLFEKTKHSTKDRKIVDKYLKLLGLGEQNKQLFKTLSGGEKQRVLLARALSQETDLIVLDEVTNHLDIRYQYKVLETLKKLNLTIISAIHDLNLAIKFCDHIVIMNNGTVIELGKPQNVINKEILKNVFGIEAEIIKKQNGTILIDYINSCN